MQPTKIVSFVAEEFFGSEHPRKQIKTQPNKSEQKRGRGRPPSHGLSKDPIYVSHREAKRRCEDKNHPDYANYGGRGIEYRFKSVEDLFDEVGPRPDGHTLDRKNVDGHYEPGNVRWATAREQARNRRPSNPRYVLEARSRAWYGSAELRGDYERRAKHWWLSLKRLNGDQLTTADSRFLNERHAETSLPFATVRNNPDLPAHYVALPSLTSQNCRCIVRVGPARSSDSGSATDRGILAGTQTIELKANCTHDELDFLNRFRNGYLAGGESGLIYSGVRELNSNRIEGRLLAAAGRFAGLRLPTRVMLIKDVAAALSIKDMNVLHEMEYLFIPDLQCWADVYGADRSLTYRLREMLAERVTNRRPTIVYLEDTASLGPDFPSIFHHHYFRASLAKVVALGPPAWLDGLMKCQP